MVPSAPLTFVQFSPSWRRSWTSSTLATNGRLPFILQLEMDANDIRVARGVQFDLNLIVLSCTKPHDYLWSYRLSTGRSMKHCALTGGWWTKIWTTEPSLFTHTRKMSSVERKLKCAEECLIVWSSTQLRRKVVHNEKRKTKGRKKFEGGVKKNGKYVKKNQGVRFGAP